MPIKYFPAEDVKKEAEEIVRILNWTHIDFNNLGFLRSKGSSSRGTIARCHALGKAMQLAMGKTTGFYLIEVIYERFDKLPKEEQIKTIIHELMHIPKTFGGGFIHHNKVHERNVKIVFEHYQNLKNNFSTSEKPFNVNRHVEERAIRFEEQNKLGRFFRDANPRAGEVKRKQRREIKWF